MPHFKKGSPEAREYMAKLRGMVGKRDRRPVSEQIRMQPRGSHPSCYCPSLSRGKCDFCTGIRGANPLSADESRAVMLRAQGTRERSRGASTRDRIAALGFADGISTVVQMHAKEKGDRQWGRDEATAAKIDLSEAMRRPNPSSLFPLDTRSTGPAFCDECEAELEDAKLTERGWVCPECGAPLGKIDFEYFVRPGEAEKAYGKRKSNPLTDEESAELLDSAHGDLMHAKASLKGPDNRAMKDYVYGKAAMAGLTVSLYGPKGLEKQGSKTFRVARRLGQRTSAQDVNYHRALRQSVEGRSRNPPLLILGNPGKHGAMPLDDFQMRHLARWAETVHAKDRDKAIDLILGFVSRHPEIADEGRSWPEILRLAERGANPLNRQEASDSLARADARRADAKFFARRGDGYVAGRELGQAMARDFDVEEYADREADKKRARASLKKTLAVGDKHFKKFWHASREVNPAAKMLPAHVWKDPAFRRELAAYKRRHGCDPKFVTVLETPPGSPKYASAWGKMPEAKYDAPPDASNKGRRVHKFAEGGGKQPYLISSVEKGPKFLQIVGGTFRAGGEWIHR